MKRLIYKHIYWSFLLTVFIVPSFVAAYSSPGKPTGYVSDFAGVLTETVEQALEEKLLREYASSSQQVAVVTVKSLGGDYIENYAVQLFKEWGIGNKEKDTGVLFLIATEDKKVRIEVGYGLEGVLTDIESAQIIKETVIPAFKIGSFEQGIVTGIDEILEKIYTDDVSTTRAPSRVDSDLIGLIVFFGIQVIVFLGSILGRTKDWWLGGVLGAILGCAVTVFGLFGMSLLVGIVLTIFSIIAGLFFDYIVSSTYKKAVQNGRDIPWWTGGGSSSSGGFGGFGGGRSGGGGASGSW